MSKFPLVLEAARLTPTSKYRAPELEKLAQYYQKLLHLQDWEVYVFLVPECELSDNAHGRCFAYPNHRAAHIYIMREQDVQARRDADGGMRFFPDESQESILVHELLHIFTQQYYPTDKYGDDPEYSNMEKSVSAISKAIVNLKTALDTAVKDYGYPADAAL